MSIADFVRDIGSFSRVVLKDGVRAREDGGLGLPKLNTEEMLLFTEWPRTVDIELSVSEEIVDSGLGMYSTFSENSTRGRDAGLVGNESREGPNGSFDTETEDGGPSKGVLGRLLLKRGCVSAVVITALQSLLDNVTLDDLLLWPDGRPGRAKGADFVGLALMAPDIPTP